jgi:hypothetical protein
MDMSIETMPDDGPDERLLVRYRIIELFHRLDQPRLPFGAPGIQLVRSALGEAGVPPLSHPALSRSRKGTAITPSAFARVVNGVGSCPPA